jgi:KDO2-lipid IV(A) lauroyltransferase
MINKGLSYLGTAFLWLVSLLPFWLLYIIADILFVLLYYVTGYRRKVVQENLRNAFPEKSDAERAEIERKYYHHLSDLIVEVIKAFTISKKQLNQRMVPVNHELLIGYLNEGRSVIGAAGHFCNWEWTGQAFCLITEKNKVIVYKPLTNKIFDRFFNNMRARFGGTLVEMKHALRKMVAMKKDLFLCVLASDQTPVRSESTYFTDFLNQPTAVFLGVEKLAKLIDTPVVFCDIRRVKRGHYTYTFVPLFENAKETAEYQITNTHVKFLENVIKEEPQYWLWSHRRWKFKPEDV